MKGTPKVPVEERPLPTSAQLGEAGDRFGKRYKIEGESKISLETDTAVLSIGGEG